MDAAQKKQPVSCFSKEYRLTGIFAQRAAPAAYQSLTDPEALEQLARQSRDDLYRIMRHVTDAVEGADIVRLRVKDREAIRSKMEQYGDKDGRRPENIGDYLGGRIAVDSKAAMARVIHNIYKSAHVIGTRNRLYRPSEGGYRALHVQIAGHNGFSAEIQILPREISDAKQEADVIYQRWRRKDITGESRAAFEADKKRENELFTKAWKAWEARTMQEQPFTYAPAAPKIKTL